jgi:hypothetical protein
MFTSIAGWAELSTLPVNRRHVRGYAADDLALEQLDDLGASLFLPLPGAGDCAAVFQSQHFGQVGVGIGQRLVIVGGIGRIRIGIAAGTQLRDAELAAHVLMVLLGAPARCRAGGRLFRADEQSRRQQQSHACRADVP